MSNISKASDTNDYLKKEIETFKNDFTVELNRVKE